MLRCYREALQFLNVIVAGTAFPNRAAIPPVGQARIEFDIFAALARLSGVDEAFTEGRDAWAWIRRVYEEARLRGARGCGTAGIRYLLATGLCRSILR
jgi:hypothetical protein